MRALTRRAAFDRPSTRASRRRTGAVSPDDREAIGAVGKCAAMGLHLRPETTGPWRETPSLRRRRYATERPMSARFAANTPIAAGRSNAAISARRLRWKRSCPSRPLPVCFPGSPGYLFFSKPGAAVSLDGLRLRGRADRPELVIQPAASIQLVRRWANETNGIRHAKVRW